MKSILLLILMQMLVVLPACFSSQASRALFTIIPELTLYSLTWIILVVIFVSAFLLLIMHAVNSIFKKSSVAINVALLLLVHIFLFLQVYFYSFFGIFPAPNMIKDLIQSPILVINYTLGGILIKDYLILIVYIFLSFLIAIKLSKTRFCKTSLSFGILILSLGLLFGLQALWSNEVLAKTRGHAMRSFPQVKLFTEIISFKTSNNLNVIKKFLPSCKPSLTQSDINDNEVKVVILILAESLRADHFKAYGYPRNTTPSISKDPRWIAFQKFFANTPVTSLSIPLIFNSRYFAFTDFHSKGDIFKDLNSNNVNNFVISTNDMRWSGLESAIGINNCQHYFNVEHLGGARVSIQRNNLGEIIDDHVVYKKLGEVLSYVNEPFFGTLLLAGNHHPYYSKDVADFDIPVEHSSYSSSMINDYDKSIVYLDRGIAKLVALLQEKNLLKNSLIILSSDHGQSLGEHDLYFHGSSLYNEQIKVPLFIRVGENLDGLHPHLLSKSLNRYSHIDLLPTIYDLFSLKSNSHEGCSILSSTEKEYDIVYNDFHSRLAGIIKENKKLIYNLDTNVMETFNLSNEESPLRTNAISNLNTFLEHETLKYNQSSDN